MARRQTPVEKRGRRLDGTGRKFITLHLAGAQTTGTGKFRFRAPSAGTYVSTVAHINTVNTGATFILDVNKNGTTLYTTQARRPTIAISAATKTSTETAQADITSFVEGDIITIDIDQIGSTIAGSDLSVTFVYEV